MQCAPVIKTYTICENGHFRVPTVVKCGFTENCGNIFDTKSHQQKKR